MKLLPLALAACLLLPALSVQAADRAVSTYTETSPAMNIKVSWERFGLPLPDRFSDAMVAEAVAAFRVAADEEYEGMMQSREPEARFPLEMNLEGTIYDNGRTACILWENYQYLGGAHGNLALYSRNYRLPEGTPLEFDDVFREPEKALLLVSALSRSKLLQRDLPESMVTPGTEPKKENFQTFRLEKDGITFYFAPYQVASWADGVITVTLSLSELAEAGPNPSFWN